MTSLARGLGVPGIVVANAALQAAAVLGDPVPEADVAFGALVVASSAVVVVAVWAVQLLLSGRSWRASGVLLSVVAAGVVAAALSGVAWAPLVVVVLLVGGIVLPAIADGARAGSAFRVFRSAPVRAILGVLVVIVLWAAAWIAALLLGFFVTGPLAAFATWVLFGAAGVGVLAMWTSLWRRHGDGPAASGRARRDLEGTLAAPID